MVESLYLSCPVIVVTMMESHSKPEMHFSLEKEKIKNSEVLNNFQHLAKKLEINLSSQNDKKFKNFVYNNIVG